MYWVFPRSDSGGLHFILSAKYASECQWWISLAVLYCNTIPRAQYCIAILENENCKTEQYWAILEKWVTGKIKIQKPKVEEMNLCWERGHNDRNIK